MTEEHRIEYWKIIYNIICLILKKHKVEKGSDEIWLLLGFGASFIFLPLLKLREKTAVYWEKMKTLRHELEESLNRNYPRWRELHELPVHRVLMEKDILGIRYQWHALLTFTPNEEGSEVARLNEVIKWALLAGVCRDHVIKQLKKLPETNYVGGTQ